MNNRPKRRKFKDNPYELEIDNNAYLIKFVDGNRKLQIIEVSPEVFKVFDDSELSDLSQMNEYDNHIEHAEICENTLYKNPDTGLYYLVVCMSSHTPEQFNKVCNIISEYVTSERPGPLDIEYFKEHYEVIVKDKAVQVLKKL